MCLSPCLLSLGFSKGSCIHISSTSFELHRAQLLQHALVLSSYILLHASQRSVSLDFLLQSLQLSLLYTLLYLLCLFRDKSCCPWVSISSRCKRRLQLGLTALSSRIRKLLGQNALLLCRVSYILAQRKIVLTRLKVAKHLVVQVLSLLLLLCCSFFSLISLSYLPHLLHPLPYKQGYGDWIESFGESRVIKPQYELVYKVDHSCKYTYYHLEWSKPVGS